MREREREEERERERGREKERERDLWHGCLELEVTDGHGVCADDGQHKNRHARNRRVLGQGEEEEQTDTYMYIYTDSNSWPLAISEQISKVATQNLELLGLNCMDGQPTYIMLLTGQFCSVIFHSAYMQAKLDSTCTSSTVFGKHVS